VKPGKEIWKVSKDGELVNLEKANLPRYQAFNNSNFKGE
jgi:hypothetical protein